MAFNKDQFVAQNRKNVEENPFGEIDNGIYVCDLVSAQLNYSKGKGLYQALFQWKIDPEANDRFKGQNIFVNVGLQNEDKSDKPEGYKIFDIILSTLGVNDRGSFAEDAENNMRKLEGTKAQIKVTENGAGFKQNRINRLIRNAWKENQANSFSQNVQNQVQNYEQQNSNPVSAPTVFTNSFGVKVEKDSKVSVNRNNGTILSVVPESKQALIQFDDTNVATGLYSFDDLQQPIDTTITAATTITNNLGTVETIEEITPTPTKIKLELGMNVQGRFGDTHVSGTVHRIDEAGGIVVIASQGKGYPCPVDTVQVIQ